MAEDRVSTYRDLTHWLQALKDCGIRLCETEVGGAEQRVLKLWTIWTPTSTLSLSSKDAGAGSDQGNVL